MENTTQRIRCFIAIEIPRFIQERLAHIQDTLKKQISQVSWVKSDNIHMTLKFIGEVEQNQLSVIEPAIEQVTQRYPPFALKVGGIGAFPNLKRPRVIWVGVKVGGTEVSALARGINLELNQHGYPFDEGTFHSHLTLARIKNRIDLRPFVDIFRQYNEIENASMTVNEIALVRSQLHPKGAIYTILKSYALPP
jgi:2'-5' RNA ligase